MGSPQPHYTKFIEKNLEKGIDVYLILVYTIIKKWRSGKENVK